MFRAMIRSRQALSREDCVAILTKEPRGVLSLLGDGGYPYGVPLDHWYCEEDGKIYFHCGKRGHKIDAIRHCDKASFCVIEQDEIIPEKYTTYYRSAIAFGKVRILEDDAEIRGAICQLAGKYRPGHEADRMGEIEKELPALCMFVLEVESMTGKEAIELVRRRTDSCTDNN